MFETYIWIFHSKESELNIYRVKVKIHITYADFRHTIP